MSARLLSDRDGSDLAHELAHQWYGDEVTPDNWPDLWMNESFAMYVQIRWDASHDRADWQFWQTQLRHDQRLRNADGPPGRYFKRDFASLCEYICGALMLKHLRHMLGGKTFGAVLRGWPAVHRFGNVHRSEWVTYLNRVSGRNLTSFVHRWLDSKRTPA